MSFDAKFEVRNRLIEDRLREIGHQIGSQIPRGFGFALMIFTYGEGGDFFYISDAQRHDLCNVMREFIAKHDPN